MAHVDWVWASPPDAGLRELAALVEAGQPPPDGELLRHKRPRSVWRLPQVGGGVVLKHYRVDRVEAWRSLLLPGRAEREYRVMESFCRRGLPTVRPLAFGERRRGRRLVEAWFLSRLVPEAVPLADRLEALHKSGEGCAWRRLAERAMAVVAQLHRHPYFHRDLHAGNLLLDGADNLLVVDLHSVWNVPWVTAGMREENLARLLFSLRGSLSLDAMAPLVRIYAVEAGLAVDSLVWRVRRRLGRFEQDWVRGRSARAMRHSSEFVGERSADGRIHRRRSYGLEQLARDLAEHETHLRDGGDRLLGRARASWVTRVGDEPGRVVKEYRRRGVGAALRTRLGLGRARGAWKAARRCLVVGVPTPEALALLERPDGSAVLVTQRARGSTLEELAAALARGGPVRARAAVALSVGHVVGCLARAGLRHDDMSSKNLLVGEGAGTPTGDLRTMPPVGGRDVQLIDLDNMRRTRPRDRRSLARMLGQLGDLPSSVTRTDRWRFLLGYRRAAGADLPRDVMDQALRLTRQRQERRARLEGRLDGSRPRR